MKQGVLIEPRMLYIKRIRKTMRGHTMKKLLTIFSLIILAAGSAGSCLAENINMEAAVTPERPSDADLMAFKVYHHAVYLVTTTEQAGGTNKLHHTTELPTEGTDPVVTPALDHIYTKAVLDLTDGPVVMELPKVEDDRYFSIQIADQEHYTIYDEIQPDGKYAIVRKGKKMHVPEGATVIESPGDYPHIFIRAQVKNPEDIANVIPIQQKIKLTATSSKILTIENPVKFTLQTQDVYPQNKEILASAVNFSGSTRKRVGEF